MNNRGLASARMLLHFIIQARAPHLFTGFLAILLLLTLPLRAQEQEPVFRVEVRLVQIEVRVTQNEEPLKNLQREGFLLKEDGEIQEISRIEFIAGPGPPRDVQSPSTKPDSADPETEQPPPKRNSLTWIYLLPEVQNAVEFRRAVPALLEFLNE